MYYVYNKNLVDNNEHILFTGKYNIPNLLNDVLNNYNEYYQKLNIDNVNIDFHKNYIESFNLFN